MAKGANKAPRNRPSCFFISCFTVSITPSINTPESSNNFIILVISFISSFEISKVNPLFTLTDPFPLIFLSNLFITLEVKFLTNLGNLSLPKEITIFVSAFFPKLLNQEPKDPHDWIILDIWALLSFISVQILLAKTSLILVVCLVVRSNSYGSSLSSTFFLFNFNLVPVLFFAADFNLFNCVFVSSTLDNWPPLIRELHFVEKILISFLEFFLKLLRQT